jgi:hypothetical protein
MVPAKKLGVVVLTNGMTGLPSAMTSYVLDQLLGRPERDWSGEGVKKAAEARAKAAKKKQEKEAQRITGTSPSRPLAEYAGRYGGPMYGDATVALEGEKLVLRLESNRELTADLIHWQHDVFAIKWHREFAWFGDGKAHFVLNADSRPVEIRLDVPNEDFWFDELELKRK